MENDNKSFEELADEALDKVAGGMTFSTDPCCCECGRDYVPLGSGLYFDPAGYTESVYGICEECLKTDYGPEWVWHKL